MPGNYNGVEKLIKDVCRFAEYCPCCGHSLNLIGLCTVETCPASASLLSFRHHCFRHHCSAFGIIAQLSASLLSFRHHCAAFCIIAQLSALLFSIGIIVQLSASLFSFRHHCCAFGIIVQYRHHCSVSALLRIQKTNRSATEKSLALNLAVGLLHSGQLLLLT